MIAREMLCNCYFKYFFKNEFECQATIEALEKDI